MTLVTVVVAGRHGDRLQFEPASPARACVRFGTLSLLTTGALLVLKVPENRLSWVMLLVALGDGLMNAADDVGARQSRRDRRWHSPSSPSSFLASASSCPSGFPPAEPSTPRWRWVSATAMVGVIGLIGGWAMLAREGAGSADVDSCVSVATCANILGLLLILVGIVGGRSFRSSSVGFGPGAWRGCR